MSAGADWSRTCEGCAYVVNEPRPRDVLWARCFAPGQRYGYVVSDNTGRFLPYVPAWCPKMEREAEGGEIVSVCKDCGAEIDWMRIEGGKYIPVDWEPVFVIEGEGDERFYDDELGEITGRMARAEEVQTREDKIINALVGYVPHWRTCPCAADFRRKR